MLVGRIIRPVIGRYMFATCGNNGEIFEDIINLSNSNECSDEEIMVTDGDNVYFHWWETDENAKRVQC
jgi:hypothetical protein